jgi:hypothetical protein
MLRVQELDLLLQRRYLGRGRFRAAGEIADRFSLLKDLSLLLEPLDPA